MIYLDNAASTKPSEAVINKINEVIEIYGNPSSIHDIGAQARHIVLGAKQIIANKVNCNLNEIHFTSGATMSNNLFIQGFLMAHPNGRLVISAIEHNDIIKLADHLDEIHGKYWVHRLGVDSEGNVYLPELENILKVYSKNNIPVLCCIQWANGECGTIQDMRRISEIVHSYDNAYLYSDVTQYCPYFKLDLDDVKLDGFGMSGQKIHCIKGTGVMYVRHGVEITPIIWGEQDLVGGTENVIGIAALATAFDELDYDNTSLYEKRDYMIQEFQKLGVVIGSLDHRLPNNVCTYLNKNDGDYFIVLLNEMGICASSGSACSSGSGDPSHVVIAMGHNPIVANSCIRFTLSKENTIEEIHEVVSIVKEILTNDMEV